ncbi:MAG: 3-phosphoshikimate 1-carboxyvinyltransferase [Lachnospiraceae bacterium]|jgi:3-phosphoshikimate 1-carboxyvinyltransferase|nr:3-phosphoshikimate 1-carboxyvinyltransferase [Lachnospiraceae bacterium]
MKKIPLCGELTVPGDKSISHRSIMFGALAKGTTKVENFLQGADCLSTINCFQAMGISIENSKEKNQVLIHGKGLHGLTAPKSVLDCGNSGTTTRLLSGILAAQPFTCELTGDASIQKRPMGRIITPLSAMGADITGIKENRCAPLRIRGRRLSGIHYQSPVASAQVKSAVLLAGLYADGITTVTEPYLSRNHTELMLGGFGAKVECCGTSAALTPPKELYAQELTVPGDISSAAYFLTAAALIPGSELLIRNVGINPTRDGILQVYRNMGADITFLNGRTVSGEPAADLLIRGGHLHGTSVGGAVIPSLIDELPIIAVAACFADGETVISDAEELKVKESNRIAVMTEGLSAMGADVTETEDGMIIRGGRFLKAASIDSHLDHRIAMSFTIAGLLSGNMPDIKGMDCVKISYPDFYRDLERLVSAHQPPILNFSII